MGSSITGRDSEIEAIGDTLRHSRLVTILGPGGVGKTTLARALVEHLDAAPHWIELAAVEADADGRRVAMRMLGQPDVDAFAATADDRTLVVLDNCEHQLEVAAELATDLLGAHPGLRVVATSRTDLAVPAEVRYPIGPLSLRPEHGRTSPAADLFARRSEQFGASWPDTDANTGAIQSIVERLVGIPLAIELAAAQAAAIGPVALAPLLEDDPLDVLVDDRGQHRSVRATVAASLDRLDDPTRRFFERLSVVGFPFDVELAAVVTDTSAADALLTCNRLARVSLLTAVHDDDAAGRFRTLEPIRALARERLGDDEARAAESRYVDALARFADRAVERALSTYELDMLGEAGRRYPHIVRAIELAVAHDDRPDRVFRIVLPLLAPGCGPRSEVVSLGRRIIDRWPEMMDPEADVPPLRAEALAVLAHTAALAADEDHALRVADAALADPDATRVADLLARRARAMTLAFLDRTDEACTTFELAIAEGSGISPAIERELRSTWLGMLPYDQEVHAELVELANAAAAADDLAGLTWVIVAMTNGLVLTGRPEEAAPHLRRAAERSASSGERWTGASIARSQAMVESARGVWNEAAVQWRRCIDRHLATGDVEGAAVGLRLAAGAAERCGRSDVADELWHLRPPGRANTAMPMPFREEEATLVERNGTPLPVPLSRSIARIRELLPEAADGPSPVEAPPAVGSPAAAAEHVVHFGEGYVLDLGRRELLHAGVAVHVEPQVFDVLAHLAANAGRMVTRDELMDSVWQTRFVTAAAVSSRIRSARAAAGDDGKRQEVIRTVHGHGFEFVARITDVRTPADTAESDDDDRSPDAAPVR